MPKKKEPQNDPNRAWFTVQLRALREAIALLRGVAPRRSTLPVLSHVLVKTTADALLLAATDLSVFVTLQVPAQVDAPDLALALPARVFGDWLNTQQNKDALLVARHDAESATAELQVARHSAHLKALAADEFPAQPPVPNGITIALDAGAFAQSVRRVAFAAASEKEGHHVLEGVFTRMADAKISLVAADGFQLAYDELPLDAPLNTTAQVVDPALSRGVTIPTEAITLIAKLAGHAENASTPLALTLAPTHVRLAFGDRAQVIATLIEGNYPDFGRLIPTDRITHATIEPVPLLNALQAAAPFSDAGVELTFAPEGLTLAGVTPQSGDLTALIPLRSAMGLDAPFHVRVQREFLRHVLTAIAGAEELTFDLNANADPQHPSQPLLLSPSAPAWKYVVMPLAA